MEKSLGGSHKVRTYTHIESLTRWWLCQCLILLLFLLPFLRGGRGPTFFPRLTFFHRFLFPGVFRYHLPNLSRQPPQPSYSSYFTITISGSSRFFFVPVQQRSWSIRSLIKYSYVDTLTYRSHHTPLIVYPDDFYTFALSISFPRTPVDRCFWLSFTFRRGGQLETASSFFFFFFDKEEPSRGSSTLLTIQNQFLISFDTGLPRSRYANYRHSLLGKNHFLSYEKKVNPFKLNKGSTICLLKINVNLYLNIILRQACPGVNANDDQCVVYNKFSPTHCNHHRLQRCFSHLYVFPLSNE